MSDWKPRVKHGLRWDTLALTAEDGFLLSRIDGRTSVEALSHLTGLPIAQVQAGLSRLQAHGALEPDRPPTPAAPAAHRLAPRPAAAPLPADDVLFEDDGTEVDAIARAALQEALGELSDDDDIVDDADATAEGDAPPTTARTPLLDEVDASAAGDRVQPIDGPPPPTRDDASAADGDESEHEDEDEDEDEDEGEGEGEDNAVEAGNHRKLFETTLHDLPEDERQKLAKTATGAVLLALCFDPLPAVIAGIFENGEAGFPHARLVARHHRTPQGLEALLTRAELARDGQVQRYLLANPMLNDAQLKKLLQPRRVDALYKIALSRDLPEKNRSKVRILLRSKWSVAEGEERAALVFSTEGRVLTMLTGLPFDSQTATLLCGRTYNSVMLIQNIARFSATPPLVLTHMLKQALVKRQPHLRTLIAQHPNCPSDVKRKLREG